MSNHLHHTSAAFESVLRHHAKPLGRLFSLKTLRTPDDFPNFHNFIVQGRTLSGQIVNASGFDQERSLASLKAIGEFIERYSLLSASDPHIIVTGARKDLIGPVLGLDQLPLFTDEQLASPDFPWKGYTDTLYEWTEVKELGGTSRILVPVDLLSLHKPSRIGLMGSTGAAAHTDETKALISGILELVERDALSIVWETQAVTPRIACNAGWHFKETRQLIDQLEAADQQVILRDITTDIGVPVVAAVIRDRRERRPCLVLGAGAALSLVEACKRALDEAIAVWLWMRDEHGKRETTLERVAPLAFDAVEPMWQAVLYGFREMLHDTRILTASSKDSVARPHEATGMSPSESLERLCSRLKVCGIDVYFRSILAPELNDLGWYVTRVIAPDLVPLGFGSLCRPLGHPRLHSVPETCGWKHTVPPKSGKQNPIPLP
ncbi:MAG: YcaO-like family protein [Magnetococcales bacterium]|nr:YcaO-like family protein [Magnetococcales bacterium]